MFVENFFKYVKAFFALGDDNATQPIYLTSITGYQYNSWRIWQGCPLTFPEALDLKDNLTKYDAPRFFVGSDGRPAKRTDYKLYGLYKNSYSDPSYAVKSVTLSNKGLDERGRAFSEFKIECGNDDVILSINEIGLIWKSFDYGPYFLFERSVLPSPLIIPIGKRGVITYRITNGTNAGYQP